MVHGIECLSKVQEEHSTDSPTVNLVKNIGQEVGETRNRGVSPPEPGLVLVQNVVIDQVAIYLSMGNTFH